MEIIILGSGTCVPTGSRGPSAYAVLHNDSISMVDMGGGCLEKLAREGLSFLQIDRVIITHFHVDHTSELPLLLFANNYNATPRTSALTIMGPEGTGEFLDRMKSLYRWIKPKHYTLKTLEGEAPSLSIEGHCTITTCPAEHGDGRALSARFDLPPKSVTFSGDTGYSKKLVSLARDTDILIVECSFPEGHEDAVEGHLTPHLAGRMVNESGARKVILTHLYPEAIISDPRESFREICDADVVVAHDLMRLTL